MRSPPRGGAQARTPPFPRPAEGACAERRRPRPPSAVASGGRGAGLIPAARSGAARPGGSGPSGERGECGRRGAFPCAGPSSLPSAAGAGGAVASPSLAAPPEPPPVPSRGWRPLGKAPAVLSHPRRRPGLPPAEGRHRAPAAGLARSCGAGVSSGLRGGGEAGCRWARGLPRRGGAKACEAPGGRLRAAAVCERPGKRRCRSSPCPCAAPGVACVPVRCAAPAAEGLGRERRGALNPFTCPSLKPNGSAGALYRRMEQWRRPCGVPSWVGSPVLLGNSWK